MAKSADRVGSPKALELQKSGRIKIDPVRGIDLEPNPCRIVKVTNRDGVVKEKMIQMGHCKVGDSPWRKGLDAEKYHALKIKEAEVQARTKEFKQVAPDLDPEEFLAYEEFLKKGGKKVAIEPALEEVSVVVDEPVVVEEVLEVKEKKAAPKKSE